MSTQREHIEFEVVVEAFYHFNVVIVEQKFTQVGEVLHKLDFLDGAVS